MGTRSLTVLLDGDGTEICVLGRNLDGHLSGHAVDLRRFLRGYLVGQISRQASQQENRTASNMGRLAALLIAEFKAGIGDFTVLPSGTRNRGEDYIYTVYPRTGTTAQGPSLLKLKVQTPTAAKALAEERSEQDWRTVFDGFLDEFDPDPLEMQWDETEEGEELTEYIGNDILTTEQARSASH